jgi:hypothetical protein
MLVKIYTKCSNNNQILIKICFLMPLDLAAPIEFHAADRRLADVAAGFKARFKISLAEAFAAVLPKERKAELVTGDPEFRALEKEIKIRWLA